MSLLLLLGASSSVAVNRFARFNGTTDYATIPSHSMPSSEGTFLARVRLDAATPDVGITGFFEINVSSGYSHYPYIDGLAYVAIFRATRVDGITLSGSINRTQWHWVVVRSDSGSGWEMLQASDAGVLYSVSTAAHEAFNQNCSGGFIAKTTASEMLDGGIDRMLLFSTRLSDADIQAVIAGGNGTSPLLRYEFSSDAGGVFADSSGNGKDATITGSPTIIAA